MEASKDGAEQIVDDIACNSTLAALGNIDHPNREPSIWKGDQVRGTWQKKTITEKKINEKLGEVPGSHRGRLIS